MVRVFRGKRRSTTTKMKHISSMLPEMFGVVATFLSFNDPTSMMKASRVLHDVALEEVRRRPPLVLDLEWWAKQLRPSIPELGWRMRKKMNEPLCAPLEIVTLARWIPFVGRIRRVCGFERADITFLSEDLNLARRTLGEAMTRATVIGYMNLMECIDFFGEPELMGVDAVYAEEWHKPNVNRWMLERVAGLAVQLGGMSFTSVRVEAMVHNDWPLLEKLTFDLEKDLYPWLYVNQILENLVPRAARLRLLRIKWRGQPYYPAPSIEGFELIHYQRRRRVGRVKAVFTKAST